jgi:hypothetical protein
MDRDSVLSRAVDECLKELYSYVQPTVSWNDFKYQNKIYSSKYRSWEEYRRLLRKKEEKGLSKEELEKFSIFPANWENKSITECIGPRPYEFYYLPKEILKDICNSYVHAYKLDQQQELLDTIETLKNYCKDPIVDKYINDWTDETGLHHPGYRSYDHPDNLEKEITKILGPEAEDNPYHVHKICDKFFEFLDMAGNFFNWNRDLNSFNVSVYMGPSPNSYKEAVIENWKKYRNQDIEIDEEQIKKDYYGEDELD